MNTAKKHATHGFSQFRLTNNLINNLSQFEVTPTAKLVLLYLSSCYNPNKADMFPKQKTIAQKIGVSERSIVRAISELVKAGLILVECKYTNRYKFGARISAQCGIVEKNFAPENMSDDLGQNDNPNRDNLSHHDIEPTKKPINEPQSVEDFKILKDYATSKGAKNVTAYINALRKSGADKKIINDFRAKKAIENYAKKQIEETAKQIQEQKEIKGVAPTEEFKRIKERLRMLAQQ